MGRSRLNMRYDELAKARPILSTVHGSHLYGLAHEHSDFDTYEVVLGCDKRFAWNHNAETDATHIHLSRFHESVEDGAPQALEALFSPVAEVAPGWEAFFLGLRPGIDNARATYRRTIMNFGLSNGGRTGRAAERIDPVKMRRHALRLAINLNDLVRYGVFNPRLSDFDAWVITSNAVSPGGNFEEILIRALDAALLGNLRTGSRTLHLN